MFLMSMAHKVESFRQSFGFPGLVLLHVSQVSLQPHSGLQRFLKERVGSTAAISTVAIVALGTGMGIGRWYRWIGTKESSAR